MQLYVILRRDGWSSPAELERAAARSTQVADEEMSDDVRWIRSYVLEEGGGSVGTVCIYEATSPEAIHGTPRGPTCPSTRSSRSPTRCFVQAGPPARMTPAPSRAVGGPAARALRARAPRADCPPTR